MTFSDDYFINYGTKFVGVRELHGQAVEVRWRLTGWHDGIKWWTLDYRTIKAPAGWRFWYSRGPWTRTHDDEYNALKARAS